MQIVTFVTEGLLNSANLQCYNLVILENTLTIK